MLLYQNVLFLTKVFLYSNYFNKNDFDKFIKCMHNLFCFELQKILKLLDYRVLKLF